MKRIALLLFLTSAAFGQSGNPRAQTRSLPAGRQATGHMLVSCVVTPSAVVRAPLFILNASDLQTLRSPQETSAHGQTFWVPMTPNRRIGSLASVVTVNDKTAAQSDDIPFTATEQRDDKYIYLIVSF